MRLSPKQKRNLSRILPFGIIWLVLSWIFLFYDYTLTQNENINPDTDITLTLPVFIFANFMITLTGLMVGTLEIVILEKYFKRFSLGKKVLYKFLTYLLFILAIISIAFPIAASIESGVSLLDREIWEKLGRYFLSLTFLNTILQLAFFLLISLIYAAISENIGHQVLRNFFTGKYYYPTFEKRVFMFLDMKDSTAIAEKLGHIQYFNFLKDYYHMMSGSIIDHLGEVYQYIGDEVVISWNVKSAFYQNNCISVFDSLKQSLKKKESNFMEAYGILPDFKAGVHLGDVTVGEIGALKKEIVFSGDVLNTTARIQALCKGYDEDLIISEELLKELEPKENWNDLLLGELQLRGKSIPTKIHAVRFTSLVGQADA